MWRHSPEQRGQSTSLFAHVNRSIYVCVTIYISTLITKLTYISVLTSVSYQTNSYARNRSPQPAVEYHENVKIKCTLQVFSDRGRSLPPVCYLWIASYLHGVSQKCAAILFKRDRQQQAIFIFRFEISK